MEGWAVATASLYKLWDFQVNVWKWMRLKKTQKNIALCSPLSLFTNRIRNTGLLFKEVKSDFKFLEPALKQQLKPNKQNPKHKWHNRIELEILGKVLFMVKWCTMVNEGIHVMDNRRKCNLKPSFSSLFN